LTDKDGRFELPGVVPDLVYAGAASGPTKMGGRMQLSSLGRVFENVSAESGQTKDLGDLRIQPRNPGGKKPETKSDASKQKVTKPGGTKKAKAKSDAKPIEPPAQTRSVSEGPALARSASEGNPSSAPENPNTSKPSAETVRGRVVSADQKAIAGAKVYWFQSRMFDMTPRPATASNCLQPMSSAAASGFQETFGRARLRNSLTSPPM
jgi:hypothetical protein